MIWQFSSNGVYSTQSLYEVVNFRGNLLWSLLYGVSKSHLESTISCGFFQKNKVLTRDNLVKRIKVEDGSCLFCCEEEFVNHLSSLSVMWLLNVGLCYQTS